MEFSSSVPLSCRPLPAPGGSPPLTSPRVRHPRMRPSPPRLWRQPADGRQRAALVAPLLPPVLPALAPKQMTSSVEPTPTSQTRAWKGPREEQPGPPAVVPLARPGSGERQPQPGSQGGHSALGVPGTQSALPSSVLGPQQPKCSHHSGGHGRTGVLCSTPALSLHTAGRSPPVCLQ